MYSSGDTDTVQVKAEPGHVKNLGISRANSASAGAVIVAEVAAVVVDNLCGCGGCGSDPPLLRDLQHCAVDGCHAVLENLRQRLKRR